ncbi:hypothetical protein Aperf_G00000017874 [Anoplocephala perfoliata]
MGSRKYSAAVSSDPYLKPALKTFGVFSQPEYYSEPYVNPDPSPFRAKIRPQLRPMYLAGGYSKSRAANTDGYFEPFKRGFEGEDQIQHARSHAETGKKWIPPPIGQKRCGIGSPFGNFTTVIPAVDNGTKEEYEVAKELRNFYTNPGKKGTGYGYPNVAFNPLPEWKPGEGIHSDLNVDSIADENRKHFELCLGRAPFISQQAQGRMFNPNPFAGGDPLAPGGPPIQKFRATDASKSKTTRPIFYPPHVPKKDGGGKAGTFSKFPEYQNEPFREMVRIVEEQSRSKGLENQPLWLPPGNTALVKPSMSVWCYSVTVLPGYHSQSSRMVYFDPQMPSNSSGHWAKTDNVIGSSLASVFCAGMSMSSHDSVTRFQPAIQPTWTMTPVTMVPGAQTIVNPYWFPPIVLSMWLGSPPPAYVCETLLRSNLHVPIMPPPQRPR